MLILCKLLKQSSNWCIFVSLFSAARIILFKESDISLLCSESHNVSPCQRKVLLWPRKPDFPIPCYTSDLPPLIPLIPLQSPYHPSNIPGTTSILRPLHSVSSGKFCPMLSAWLLSTYTFAQMCSQ